MADENKRGSDIRRITVSRLDNKTGLFVKTGYEINVLPHETVLDALIRIKEIKDRTLSVRYSCRMGICGSCGMVINGKPSLACQTQVSHLKGDITVSPMLGHPVIRDLINDFGFFFHKHKSVHPWIIAGDANADKFSPKHTTKQKSENVEELLPFSSCINCGLCLDACPVANSDPDFIGPQALAQAQRFNLDSRDKGREERSLIISGGEGIWGCEFIGACSKVCPKGVDPALAIQELKIEAMKKSLGMKKRA
jgi:succinate dehydrogenase / fumarate reductase iron-sulfur subunit